MESNFYCVTGYGWSGSGAVVDLLKEYDGFISIDSEYPLISEPHGFIDLEIFLIQNWHFLRHHKAINDFLIFCKKINKKKSLYNINGINIGNKLSVDFMKISYDFINEIIDFSYKGRSRINLYHLNKLENIITKFKWKFFDKNYTKMYFSRPTEKKFLNAIQNFHIKLFEKYINNGFGNIILDQAIPANNMYRAMRYFPNSKLIIVDRDPRDIFADLVRSKGLIGPELNKLNIESVNKFIKWHTELRKTDNTVFKEELNKNILKINFEDLVINYNKEVKKISKFIGPELKQTKNKYFDPSISKKNIGLWKKINNQELMEKIKMEINYPYVNF